MRKALYLFGILDDRDLDWLVRHGRKLTLEPGTLLIEEGKASDWLYFVLDGAFVVSTRAAPRIAVLKAGEVIGEVSFVDARPPTASVRAEVVSKVGAVARAVLAQKLQEDVGFAARLYKSIATFLADRLRATVGSLGVQKLDLDESIEDVDELASHLLSNISIAGARFAEMQRREWGEDSSGGVPGGR
jgi:CRP/FNR family transcriptional regulator, cyclic AMP receptor protein